MDDQASAPRYGIDPYLDWSAAEGIPVVDGRYAVDLFSVKTEKWPRFGVNGAIVNLEGRGDFCNVFLMELGPGASSAPLQHLYEDIYYVLEGHGSTQVELADGTRRSFEWGPKAMFAIPINCKHRHFNSSGRERTLIVTTTTFPLLMNAFKNEKFIFGTNFDFSEREGKANHFNGEGDFIPIRAGNHLWETNFVPDMATLELQAYHDRGGGSSNIKFVLAEGVMSAHMSEMPVGTYKKGHRHPAGTHVFIVTGHGYSITWYAGDKDFQRVDWKHGMLFPPCENQFHQHFNTSLEPARYLATGMGNVRYPFTAANRAVMIGSKGDKRQRSSLSLKEGGNQVEYDEQDPRVHPLWLEEMKKNGVTPKMEQWIK